MNLSCSTICSMFFASVCVRNSYLRYWSHFKLLHQEIISLWAKRVQDMLTVIRGQGVHFFYVSFLTLPTCLDGRKRVRKCVHHEWIEILPPWNCVIFFSVLWAIFYSSNGPNSMVLFTRKTLRKSSCSLSRKDIRWSVRKRSAVADRAIILCNLALVLRDAHVWVWGRQIYLYHIYP